VGGIPLPFVGCWFPTVEVREGQGTPGQVIHGEKHRICSSYVSGLNLSHRASGAGEGREGVGGVGLCAFGLERSVLSMGILEECGGALLIVLSCPSFLAGRYNSLCCAVLCWKGVEGM